MEKNLTGGRSARIPGCSPIKTSHLIDVNIPVDVINLLPEKVSRDRKAIVFNQKGKTIEVAMIDPTNLDTINLIRKRTNKKVKPYLTLERDVNKSLILFKRGLRDEFTGIIEANIKKAKEVGKDLSKAAADLPIVKIIDTLIEYAAVEEASDIHIEPRDKEIIIRLRDCDPVVSEYRAFFRLV